MMGNEVQNRKTTIQKECPLVDDMGTPATGCDITPALRSGFQTLHHKTKAQEGGGKEAVQGEGWQAKSM